MTIPSQRNRVGRAGTAFDILLILLLSVAAECAHFSSKQGRHVICADSVQYVDGAEALLSADKTPHFEFRKPGYSLILAATALVLGNMGWAVVAMNHLFQALLPLGVYGLGRNLRSRLTGWIAAILLMAHLQFQYRSERIMSEVPYTTILTLSLLVLAVGLSRSLRPPLARGGRGGLSWWMLGAGVLLGAAWLTRSVAVAVIAAGLLCVVWTLRRTPRRALATCLCLTLPVIAAVLFECSLNQQYAGRFTTCTGTLGPTLLLRMRYFLGLPFSDTDSARRCLALVPERDPQDAYLVNKMDGWVAWYRALHEHGMNDWQLDKLMKQAATEMILANPQTYVRSCASVFVRHLLRQNTRRGERAVPSLSLVPPERRKPILVHSAAPDNQQSQDYWYAYWSLPQRTLAESRELVAQMRLAADVRAPFGRTGIWAALRYYSMVPPVRDALGVLSGVALVWPGFALIGCGLLGLNRRTCALLAAVYVLDAAIVAATAFSDGDIARFQYVWIATDTTLVAALVTPAVQAAATWLRPRRTLRREPLRT